MTAADLPWQAVYGNLSKVFELLVLLSVMLIMVQVSQQEYRKGILWCFVGIIIQMSYLPQSIGQLDVVLQISDCNKKVMSSSETGLCNMPVFSHTMHGYTNTFYYQKQCRIFV